MEMCDWFVRPDTWRCVTGLYSVTLEEIVCWVTGYVEGTHLIAPVRTGKI